MSEGLVGAIIGALAAVLGGIIGELIKYQLENKRCRRTQMQDAYESTEKAIYKMLATDESSTSDAMAKVCEDMAVKITLYASKRVNKKFLSLLDYIGTGEIKDVDKQRVRALNLELVQLMKEDLFYKRSVINIKSSKIFCFFTHLTAPIAKSNN